MLTLDTCSLRNHSWQLLSFECTAVKQLINYLAWRGELRKEDFIPQAVPEDRLGAGDSLTCWSAEQNRP